MVFLPLLLRSTHLQVALPGLCTAPTAASTGFPLHPFFAVADKEHDVTSPARLPEMRVWTVNQQCRLG